MFFKGDMRLKKVSDFLYYEVDAKKDEDVEELGGSKKWKLSFNYVYIKLKNVEVISRHRVNDYDSMLHTFDDADTEKPFMAIEPNVSTETSIEGFADEEEYDLNTFYCMGREKDGFYYPFRVEDPIKVILESGEPETG